MQLWLILLCVRDLVVVRLRFAAIISRFVAILLQLSYSSVALKLHALYGYDSAAVNVIYWR